MRTVLAAVCLIAFVPGCGRQAAPATSAATARSTFEQYVMGFWISRDTAAMGRALSPTMIYHYNGRVRPGDPQAHLRALRNFGGAFPDLTATIDVFTAANDLGAAMTTWTGTHTGTLCQTAGTGRKATWVVSYMFRVADGRIAELWEAWDEGSTYRQLGIDTSKCGS